MNFWGAWFGVSWECLNFLICLATLLFSQLQISIFSFFLFPGRSSYHLSPRYLTTWEREMPLPHRIQSLIPPKKLADSKGEKIKRRQNTSFTEDLFPRKRGENNFTPSRSLETETQKKISGFSQKGQKSIRVAHENNLNFSPFHDSIMRGKRCCDNPKIKGFFPFCCWVFL